MHPPSGMSSNLWRQANYQFLLVRILLKQRLSGSVFVIGIVKPWSHGASQKGELTAFIEKGALPRSPGHHHLKLLTLQNILPQGDNLGGAIGVKLEHGDGVSQVEMEDLVRGKPVESRAGVGSK
jgi:hypothetical protein